MTEGTNIPSYSDTYTSTGSTAPKTEGAVMREWSDLNQQLSKLGELVDMLRCRLGPITGPEMPIAGKLADGGPPEWRVLARPALGSWHEQSPACPPYAPVRPDSWRLLEACPGE